MAESIYCYVSYCIKYLYIAIKIYLLVDIIKKLCYNKKCVCVDSK